MLRRRSEAATRKRASTQDGLKLACGLPLPTFCEAFVSDKVLPPSIGSAGSTAWPLKGSRAAAPNSDGFAALYGNAAVRASTPATLAMAACLDFAALALRVGPLTVERADVSLAFATLDVLRDGRGW